MQRPGETRLRNLMCDGGADVLEELKAGDVPKESAVKTLQAITTAAQPILTQRDTGADVQDVAVGPFPLSQLSNLNGVAMARDGRLFVAATVRPPCPTPRRVGLPELLASHFTAVCWLTRHLCSACTKNSKGLSNIPACQGSLHCCAECLIICLAKVYLLA